MTSILLLAFPAAMIVAAGTDLASMTIHNRLVAGLVALFFAYAAASTMPLDTVGLHTVAGVGALAITFACFAAGWMGGGDAKLIAATALWIGPNALLTDYVLLASVFGGVLTLVLLLLRALVKPTTGLVSVDRLLQPSCGIPYGVALGAAGLAVFPRMFAF